MRFSLAVVLLTAWNSLADQVYSEAQRMSSLRSRRMIGGTLAPHVPWQAMVSLEELGGGFAGGALIADRWVLTAGRNLFVEKSRQDTPRAPNIPKVFLGISHRREATLKNQVAVDKVVLHPGFQNQTDWDNDLALIQLRNPVSIRENVTPIPLPERGQDQADTIGGSGVITGWGWGVYLTPAMSLKQLVLPVADHAICKAAFKNRLDDNMFCTGPSKYQENVCVGDAGSALAMMDRHGGVYAAGILSFDKSCSHTMMYAVYMKISAYLPWIHSVLRGDTEQSSALRSAVMSTMYARQP